MHGWLVLDKPFDMTSTEAVNRVRRMFDAQKAGHAGTLDPLATGILPIAFGEATKTVPYVQDSRKTYRFEARWGEARDTDDAEGQVTASSDKRPDRAEIEALLPEFEGEIEQTPPAYSAIKVAGERAYDLARDGETVELPCRIVMIYALRLIEIPDENRAVFEAETGKGAYIRALVRDLALKLGTVGHVGALRRRAVGPFTENASFTLEVLEQLSHSARLDESLNPVKTALDDIPAVAVSGGDAFKLRRGQSVVLAPQKAKTARGELRGVIPSVLAISDGDAAALCELDGLSLKPHRVFNLGSGA